MSGLFYLLPIVILIWCIMLERLSPSLSAFWASIAMIIVSLTQHPLKAWMRGSGDFGGAFRRGAREWFDGMVSGSRNMIAIGVATGAAGVIVGTISLTGAHQVVGEFVEFLSGGNLMLMLILVAIMSLILGMGLPTTANYIVVSSLMAPVIVALGAKSGLIVPLVAVHLFVFYFGILADDTPPVGLAAFAAAAISGGDPIRTGVQGFMYDIRTAILPFLFLFNTELLLIDVTFWKGIFVFLIAVVAMMLFASATQGFLFTRNRIWESVLLLLVAFTLFRPGYWLDRISEPFELRPGTEVLEVVSAEAPDADLRVTVVGPDFNDPDVETSTDITMPLGPAGDGSGRLEKLGLLLMMEDGKAKLEEPPARLPVREPEPDVRLLRGRPRRDRDRRVAARSGAEGGLLPAGDPRHRPRGPAPEASRRDGVGLTRETSPAVRVAGARRRCRTSGRRLSPRTTRCVRPAGPRHPDVAGPGRDRDGRDTLRRTARYRPGRAPRR